MLVGFVHFGKKFWFIAKKQMNFWVNSGTEAGMRVLHSNFNRAVV